VTLLSFHGLLVVDAEGFSRNRDAELPGIHTEILDVIERACEGSGLDETWKVAPFKQSTGDGILAVLPLDAMTRLIDPFSDFLQRALADSAPRLRARGLSLRLRVALHAGLVDDEHPVTAGISTATNDVSRLLDCDPLRAALRDSEPDVTFAAVILSSEVFEMFVRAGRTSLQPSQFTHVRAKVKQFDRPAFLYVPKPSRRERPNDGSTPDTGPRAPAPTGGISMGDVSTNGDTAQNVIGSQVSGGIRQDRS
jgi:hypothetical protein